MLLQMFEMQDINSTWNSLCLGQQADGSNSRSSLANLRRRSSSPLHCNVPMQSAMAVYSHKHPELDTAACNDLNLSTDNKYLNCVFHHSQPQALCGAKAKLNRLSSICQSELAATMASGSQITRSEPATRSNSIDCENDIPKLPANKISHDVESSKLRLDLIVPNGE